MLFAVWRFKDHPPLFGDRPVRKEHEPQVPEWQLAEIARVERAEQRQEKEWGALSRTRKWRRKYVEGLILTKAKFPSQCYGGCGDRIKKGDYIWFSLARRVPKCMLCEPQEGDKRVEEQIAWYEGLPDEEQRDFEDDSWEPYSDEVRNQRTELEPELNWVGVAVWAKGVSDDLDENGEYDGTGERELPFTSLHSRDELNAQNLTDLDKLLTKPVKKIVRDLEPVLYRCVREIGRVDGRERHVHADDLVVIGQLALYKAVAAFRGRSPFGAFAAVVIKNALLDYVRQERRAAVPVGAVDDSDGSDGWCDPTDGWIEWLDLKAALPQTNHANLVMLHEFGFKDRELGDAALTCVRRNRAEERIELLMAA